MEGIIRSPLQSGLRNVIKEIEKNRNKFVNFFILFFRLYPNVFLSHRSSSRYLRKLRKLMKLCGTFCKEGKCMVEAYEHTKKTRDEYLQLISKLERLPFRSVSPASAILRYDLAKWDDLVEDCLIASDPELRSLVSSIATAV